MKTIRVLQGYSIEFGGVWFNQGDTLEVPDALEFVTGEGDPKVEEIKPAAKATEEEG